MVGFLLAVLVLLMLPAPRTIAAIIWLAVFVVIWLVAVEFFGASSGAPALAGAEGPDSTSARAERA